MNPCTRPPAGWFCTRGYHADGPCAALPVYGRPRWASIIAVILACGFGIVLGLLLASLLVLQ